MSIIISFIKIFHFKSWLLHFISPFSLFLIPRLYRWWVNSSLRSEESEISDSLSEESESETCFAHLKGFGKLVELGVAFVFTMHVWMIWHIEIRNPPNNLIWSWKWFQSKGQTKEVSCDFWTTTLSNTILEKDMNSKLSEIKCER